MTRRVAARLELLDHGDHRPQVGFVGRARVVLGRLQAEAGRIFDEGVDEARRVVAQRDAGRRRGLDGFVVHVGEVGHLADVVAFLILERAAQHVEADERAEIADVAPRVDGQPARVHPDGAAIGRGEGLVGSGERVVEAHGGWRLNVPPPRSAGGRSRIRPRRP
jgi:hypothetical protein